MRNNKNLKLDHISSFLTLWHHSQTHFMAFRDKQSRQLTCVGLIGVSGVFDICFG